MHAPPQQKPAASERAKSPARVARVPAPATNRTGLPGRLKAGVERLSGLAMDDVRVHYNSPRPAALEALAYTQGRDIHVAPGQEHHLPHETWHVVQQKRGQVGATLQLRGAAINDDEGLEREADMMGARALLAPGQAGTKAQEAAMLDAARSLPVGAPVQRKFVGQGGARLTALTPEYLSLAADNWYSKFWTELNGDAYIVNVIYAQGFNYHQAERTLTVSEGILISLKDKNAGNLTSTYIGQLAHEMSHARDHLVLGKTLSPAAQPDQRLLDVLYTELKAWAIEALAALQTDRGNLGTTEDLVTGWIALADASKRAEILKSAWGKRTTNEVIRRLIHYILLYDARKGGDPEVLNAYIASKPKIAEQIAQLAPKVLQEHARGAGEEAQAASAATAAAAKVGGGQQEEKA